MKTVGSSQAKTQLPSMLAQVKEGETISIPRRCKPIARLVPASSPVARDVAQVIAEFCEYNKRQVRTLDVEPKAAGEDFGVSLFNSR